MLLLIGCYLAPTFYGVVLSFQPLDALHSGVPITLQWYLESLEAAHVRAALVRSLRTAGIASAIAVTVALVAMYSYADFSTGRRRLLLGLALLPLFVPETTHAVTTWQFLSFLGVGRGTGALVLGHAVYVIPFVSIIILLQVLAIPNEVRREAMDIGMGRRRYAWVVGVPFLWRGVVFALLFAFLLSFNEYTRASYLQGRQVYSVYLKGQLHGGGTRSIYAISSLTFGIGLLLLSAGARRLTATETRGA